MPTQPSYYTSQPGGGYVNGKRIPSGASLAPAPPPGVAARRKPVQRVPVQRSQLFEDGAIDQPPPAPTSAPPQPPPIGSAVSSGSTTPEFKDAREYESPKMKNLSLENVTSTGSSRSNSPMGGPGRLSRAYPDNNPQSNVIKPPFMYSEGLPSMRPGSPGAYERRSSPQLPPIQQAYTPQAISQGPQAPGGISQAPGGFAQAPGGISQAPGGISQAPGGFPGSSGVVPQSQGLGMIQQSQSPAMGQGPQNFAVPSSVMQSRNRSSPGMAPNLSQPIPELQPYQSERPSSLHVNTAPPAPQWQQQYQGYPQNDRTASIHSTNSAASHLHAQHHYSFSHSSLSSRHSRQSDLGVGTGSAYVKELRKRSATAWCDVPAKVWGLPIGIAGKNSSGSGVSPSQAYLKKAMDIRHSHLQPRLLASEVEDDEEELSSPTNSTRGAIGAGGASTAPAPSTGIVRTPMLDQSSIQSAEETSSGKGETLTTTTTNTTNNINASPGTRSRAPSESSSIHSVEEEVGKIRLFVANPDSDSN
ncbi:hypothetical protein TRVA0_044S00254 [Trichomonascus vanleenenianus]|uniref:uncharacterized protein n=1 Tax=Trichomonascus vanleenenianus TaxID=2268995 RepID=UPI003ECACE43